jgi:hypothetical protein
VRQKPAQRHSNSRKKNPLRNARTRSVVSFAMNDALAITAVLLTTAACAAGELASEPPSLGADARVPVAPTHANALKVDYALRGYFYAYAAQSDGLGGNATSDNFPQPIADIRDIITRTDGLHVLALVNEPRTFATKYDGFRVIVANASSSSIQFGAQDARLAMVHEAVDPSGNWAAIEYLPSSWCGNSYHTLTLPPHTYWDFTAPHYDGDFATRLRIRVDVRDGDTSRSTYSDAFPGRISRAQLTQKQGHTATNIMDPYDD